MKTAIYPLILIVVMVMGAAFGLLATPAVRQPAGAGPTLATTSREVATTSLPSERLPRTARPGIVTTDAMAASGIALIDVAQAMAAAADTLTKSGEQTGNTELVSLGRHWAADADMLRARGERMLASPSADGMVHDPNSAHQLNLFNLRANGAVMVADGGAMVDHGRAMVAEVSRLREMGLLTPVLADELEGNAWALVATGETVSRDGERMQEYARHLLESIGR